MPQKFFWLKIYLFYGVIFFLVGTFGFLLNKNSNLQGPLKTLQVIRDDFFDNLNNRDQAIPVLSVQHLPPCILIYPTYMAPEFDSLLQESRNMLQDYFPGAIAIAVTEANWENLVPKLQQNYAQSLICGLDIQTEFNNSSSAPIVNKMLFSVPEPEHEKMFALVAEMSGRLPTFKLQQFFSKKRRFIEVSWEWSSKSTDLMIALLHSYLQTIENNMVSNHPGTLN